MTQPFIVPSNSMQPKAIQSAAQMPQLEHRVDEATGPL